jgi:hypothetical protein
MFGLACIVAHNSQNTCFSNLLNSGNLPCKSSTVMFGLFCTVAHNSPTTCFILDVSWTTFMFSGILTALVGLENAFVASAFNSGLLLATLATSWVGLGSFIQGKLAHIGLLGVGVATGALVCSHWLGFNQL